MAERDRQRVLVGVGASRWARKNAGVSPTTLGKPRPVSVSKPPTTATTPTRRSFCVSGSLVPAARTLTSCGRGPRRSSCLLGSARAAPRRRSRRLPRRPRRDRRPVRGRPSPRRRQAFSLVRRDQQDVGERHRVAAGGQGPEEEARPRGCDDLGKVAISSKIWSVCGLPPVLTSDERRRTSRGTVGRQSPCVERRRPRRAGTGHNPHEQGKAEHRAPTSPQFSAEPQRRRAHGPIARLTARGGKPANVPRTARCQHRPVARRHHRAHPRPRVMDPRQHHRRRSDGAPMNRSPSSA